MKSVHEAAEAAVAMLFQTLDDAALTRAATALGDAIRGCASSAELEALLAGASHPMIGELFGMGSPDLALWADVARALVALAASLDDDAEAARVLGWARWGCAWTPLDVVRADLDPGLARTRKAVWAEAFEAHAPLFRSWLASPAGARRAAGAHALAWCTKATADDLAALLAQAERESDGEALASELLTAGVIARRLDLGADLGGPGRADAVRTVAARGLAEGGLAATCAAAALALTATPLDSSAVAALTRDALGAEPLPAAWGWRTPGAVAYRRDALALAILAWAAVLEPERGVAALAAIDRRDRVPELGELAGAALLHLGLGARWHGPAPRALTAADLGPAARAALEPFVRGAVSAPDALRRAGLPADLRGEAGRGFVVGTKLEHRVLELALGERAARWSFAELWGAVVAGDVDAEVAAQALVAAVTPDEAVELVTHFQEARMPAYMAVGEGPTLWERDQALALAVIENAAARGFDLDAMMRRVAADRRGGLPGHAAIAWLRLRPGPIPAEHRPLVKKGHVEARTPEPVRTLVAALPPGSLGP